MPEYKSVSFGLKNDDSIGFTPEQQSATEIIITFSVVNEPKTLEYKNLRYPRYKNFYGYCQRMAGAYVVDTVPLHHVNQLLHHYEYRIAELDQSIACKLADISKRVFTPLTPVLVVRLHRNYITGLRFRLVDGVIANITIDWEKYTQQCGETIEPPNDKQGVPTRPNNSSSDPGLRPPEQGGIPGDNSPNDGGTGEPGQDPAPKPGTDQGYWYFVGQGTALPGCTIYEVNVRLSAATDPAARPIYVATGPNGACPNSTDGVIRYKGQTIAAPTGVVKASFRYENAT